MLFNDLFDARNQLIRKFTILTERSLNKDGKYMDAITHHETHKLRRLEVRVSKAGSSFVYFTLESNEGLAFYSTLEKSIDDDHRDLLIHTTPEFYAQLMDLLKHLQSRLFLEILSDTLIEDSPLIESLNNAN